MSIREDITSECKLITLPGSSQHPSSGDKHSLRVAHEREKAIILGGRKCRVPVEFLKSDNTEEEDDHNNYR
jgi:hypothetical protein